jgi:hypothetical protein
MKKYRIDVEVVGYVTVEVESDTVEEGCREAARKAFAMSVADLSHKTTECHRLFEGEE